MQAIFHSKDLSDACEVATSKAGVKQDDQPPKQLEERAVGRLRLCHGAFESSKKSKQASATVQSPRNKLLAAGFFRCYSSSLLWLTHASLTRQHSHLGGSLIPDPKDYQSSQILLSAHHQTLLPPCPGSNPNRVFFLRNSLTP
jgi:hypothetical protein